MNKYNISKQPVKDVLLKMGCLTEETLLRNDEADTKSGWTFIWRNYFSSRHNLHDSKASNASKEEREKQVKEEEEVVIGSEGEKEDREKQVKEEEEVGKGSEVEVFFDHDFGFFGAVLACYNNHLVLKNSPDDWWNVIVG